MKEAFCNIIGNAIKHSPGRDVTIWITVTDIVYDNKKFYEVSIADDGPGIPDELKHKIFQRFPRGETKAHGKGLGLFIVRSLVEQSGGKVAAADRVSGDYTKGARFVLTLPAYRGSI